MLQLSKVKDVLVQPEIFMMGLVVFVLQYVVFSFRWRLVTSTHVKISFLSSVKQHLIGQFFNVFVPGGVGGDVLKALEYSKVTSIPKTESLSMTLVDRALGIFALVLFSFIFLLIEIRDLNEASYKYLHFSGLILALGLFCLLFRNKLYTCFLKLTQNLKNTFILKIKNVSVDFFKSLNLMFDQKKIIPFIVLCFFAQLLSIVFIYFIILKLTNSNPSFLLIFPLASFGFMAMAIPLTPGSIGVGQTAFYLIFKTIDVPSAEAAIIAVSLMQFFFILLSLPGGYFFLKSQKLKNNIKNYDTYYKTNS